MNLCNQLEKISSLNDLHRLIAPGSSGRVEVDRKCKFECQIGWLGGRNFRLVDDREAGSVLLKDIVSTFERLHIRASAEDKKNTPLIADLIITIDNLGKVELQKQRLLFRILTYIKQFFGSYDLMTKLNSILPTASHLRPNQKRAVIAFQAQGLGAKKFESDVKAYSLEQLLQELPRHKDAEREIILTRIMEDIEQVVLTKDLREIAKKSAEFKNCAPNIRLEIVLKVIEVSNGTKRSISEFGMGLFPNPEDSNQATIAQAMIKREG